jgi:hypothetical protein
MEGEDNLVACKANRLYLEKTKLSGSTRRKPKSWGE